MTTRALVLLLVAASTLAARPDEKPPRIVKVTLRECVHKALEKGLDIEIARYQPWIDDQSALSAEGAFDHTLYLSASGGESISATSSSLSGAPELDVDSFTQRLGVRRKLPFGLNYDLYFQSSRAQTNSAFNTLDPQWNQELGLALTLPLLKGRGEDATYSTVVIARETASASRASFHQSLSDQVLGVHRAYWDLVFAVEQKRVREQSLEVAARLLDETKKKFDRGMLAAVDVTEAESGVAGQQEGILTAENAVHDAMDRLKRLIDPELLKDETVLATADAPEAPAAELDERAAVAEAMAGAMARRPDYARILRQIAAADATLAKTANDRWPRLDFTASGALTGLEEEFNSANKELRKLDTTEWTVGVIFEFPLEGRTSDGSERKAELERRRLELERRNLEDLMLLQVREAAREVKTAEKRIAATAKAAALAQEQLQGELNRKEQGLRTTFHVLEAERRLTEAKTNAIKARIDYHIAMQSLHLSGGTLLEKNGILLEEQFAPRGGM